MAYLGLSPDYPAQYLTDVPPPGDPDNCAVYCDWLASKKAGSFTMDYMERPPGCTCPGESPVVDNKKAGFPVQPAFSTELPMTPQQIEAAVKREQSAAQGGGLALAAIAALLMLGA